MGTEGAESPSCLFVFIRGNLPRALLSFVLVLITMDRRVELAITQIESDLARSWDVAQLALLVNLSASRFRHVFKEETGVSINQYLRERRLERAEFLLRTTFLSIKEVAMESGLSSTSHFVRYFKQKYRVSPRAYRSHFRQ
jgi:AraC family transcriptional regulator of arabinose operon